MKRFKDLKLGTRLNFVIISTFLVLISILGIYTLRSEREMIKSNTDERMVQQVNDLGEIIEEQVIMNQKSAETALRVFDDLVKNIGKFSCSGTTMLIQAVNQETSESNPVQLIKVSLNGTSVYASTQLVDEVSQISGNVCSILQKIPHGYVRISTTVKKSDNSRAINTYIPNSSPVAKSLDNGESYYGRAVILGEWYHTAYKPFKLNDGTVVVLFTGIREKNMEMLKKIFDEKKFFVSGYPFLIDKNGTFIIHPTKEGSNEKDSEFFRQILANSAGYGSSKYMWEGKLKQQYFKYLPSIESYVAVSLYQDEFMKVLLKDAKGTRRALLIAVILGISIFILINVILSRSVTNSLRQGIDFARRIAQGDLTVKLNIDQQDEIGELADALSQMLSRLKEIVINIRTGAECINSASTQISIGSQQLSQGATELASSTEEISSSMEQMVSNIQQNADNAQQTEQISGKASTSMSEMNRIGKESFESMNTIAKKITIINDIAFQTNLLALNAAVEAARAGEHGRGFAVVAAEVRKLAERSKLAADEIENLSRNSLKITEKTSELLDSLVPEIQKTSQLIQEITSASLEQNAGADQINSAIQQLNSVTQQNAASSEEMATSAEELTTQAESLKESVSYFITDEDHVAGMKKPARQSDAYSRQATEKKQRLHRSPAARYAVSADPNFENFA